MLTEVYVPGSDLSSGLTSEPQPGRQMDRLHPFAGDQRGDLIGDLGVQPPGIERLKRHGSPQTALICSGRRFEAGRATDWGLMEMLGHGGIEHQSNSGFQHSDDSARIRGECVGSARVEVWLRPSWTSPHKVSSGLTTAHPDALSRLSRRAFTP